MQVREIPLLENAHKQCLVRINGVNVEEAEYLLISSMFEKYEVKDFQKDAIDPRSNTVCDLILDLEEPDVIWFYDSIQTIDFIPEYNENECYCSFIVGESYETKTITVETMITKDGNGKINYMMLQEPLRHIQDQNYFGKGYRGLPVNIPQKMCDYIEEVSMNLYEDYNNNKERD